MIAGIAFAVLYATAVLVLPALPGPDPGIIRIQALLLAFSALALVVVLAVARDRLTGPPAVARSWITVIESCNGYAPGLATWPTMKTLRLFT